MDVVAPVVGIGTIIAFVVGGIVIVRLLTSKIRQRERQARLADPVEHDRLPQNVVRVDDLELLKQRVSELEERVDFAERLLTKQREGQRLGP